MIVVNQENDKKVFNEMTIASIPIDEKLAADVKTLSNFIGSLVIRFLSSSSIDVHAPENCSVTSQETNATRRIFLQDWSTYIS